MANVPNIGILGEHDFREQFGFKAEDSDNTPSIDAFFGYLARLAYYEY